jgi:hypothetical protein
MNAVVDLVGGETLRRSYVVVKKGGVLATTVQPIDESAANRAGICATQHEVILRPKNIVSCWPTTLPNLVKKGFRQPARNTAQRHFGDRGHTQIHLFTSECDCSISLIARLSRA